MNFFRIRQRFPGAKLADVTGTLSQQLARTQVTGRIAIAVGSRGIANLPEIVRGVVGWVRGQGAEPFLVPAMGSHGGATAAGQRKILEGFGLTGINSSMEVVELGPNAFMDRLAHESDGVIVINRIKPHTSFHGRYESGLMKMIAIGLGKHAGAAAIHKLGIPGLRETMPQVARHLLATGKILFGVGIVENAYDETLALEVIPGNEIPEREPALLQLARVNMPALPTDSLDLLIVDELGKTISGTGMDTNVIGRLRIAGEAEPVCPKIGKIFVRELVGDSAYGVGLADVTTRQLVEKADWNVTRVNAETSGFGLRANIPHVTTTDDEAVEWALRSRLKTAPTDGGRIVRIQNTLHLENLIVSEPVCQEIAGRDTIEVLGPASLWDAITSSPSERQ